MKALLVGVFTLLTASAEPIATVTKALRNQTLNKEEGKELVQLCFGSKVELKELLTKKLDSGLTKQGVAMAKKMATVTQEDDGKNRLGAGLSWYLKYDENNLSSYPILARIHENSPAANASCLPGDVVASAAGFPLLHPESRNRFAQLLMIWPSSAPLPLGLLRSPSRKKLDENHPRTTPHSVTVSLSKTGP